MLDNFRMRGALIAAMIVTAALTGCAGGSQDASPTETAQQETTAQTDAQASDQQAAPAEDASQPASDDPYASGLHHIEIDVEGYGTIKATLNADVAPVTVSNFCNLASSGFYDGLTFYRIIKGFMIQGGDPLGNGRGGSGETIVGEFASNGHDNPILHQRGTISMARSSDPDSASSQFFIMHKTDQSLDGNYAAFGTVSSGMDVVDAIAENTPVEDDNGTVAPENQPRISAIRVID